VRPHRRLHLALQAVPHLAQPPTASARSPSTATPSAVPDPNFTGADGIIFVGNALYVVHNGGVQQVTFTARDYSRGTVKSVIAPESGLTTATVADDKLYVIKAEVVRAMHMQLPPDLPFKIYRFPLELFAT
jgi:hypothetical protein